MGDVMESRSGAIGSSNIGFQLLKKCGWKEGTGLGVSEQGRLEPLQTHVKTNKLGIGAESRKQKKTHTSVDKMKQNKMHVPEESSSEPQNENVSTESKKKTKLASKRLRKRLEEEKRMQEKEFERTFFREFWPDNV